MSNSENARAAHGLSAWQAILVIVWLLITSGGFGAIYYGLYVRVADPKSLVEILSAIAWPFVVLVVGIPAIVLLAQYLDRLWAIRQSLEDAPKKISDMLANLETFKTEIDTISADAANRLNESAELLQANSDTVREQMDQQPLSDGGPAALQDTPRMEVRKHAKEASRKFYEFVEAWNNDGRRKASLMKVSPGGGNRPEYVRTLRDNKKLSADEDTNAKAAEYLELVFREEAGSRHRPVDATALGRMKELHAELSRRGWFDSRG